MLPFALASRCCAAALVLAAATVVLPSSAAAGTLTANGTCFEQQQPIVLSGSGFTPDRALAIDGDGGIGGTAFPDDSGAFDDFETNSVPYDSFEPEPLTITATDQVDPARSTSLTVQVVRFGSNFPVKGNPRRVTSWEFAGFPPGATVYGHFRHDNRRVRDYAFGTAAGSCGVLIVDARRIPARFATTRAARRGGWYVQIDTRRRFSFNTRPEFDTSFSIR